MLAHFVHADLLLIRRDLILDAAAGDIISARVQFASRVTPMSLLTLLSLP